VFSRAASFPCLTVAQSTKKSDLLDIRYAQLVDAYLKLVEDQVFQNGRVITWSEFEDRVQQSGP
jgi:hypothetical protein